MIQTQQQAGKPHEESALWCRQSLWKWFLFFVFNQCFYACNENSPAGRHKAYWTELNCSQRSLATRHRQAVNKKAICQSVSAHSSNQWSLRKTGNATVGGHNTEGTTRRRPHRIDQQEDINKKKKKNTEIRISRRKQLRKRKKASGGRRWRQQGWVDNNIETSTRRNHSY